MTRNFDDSPKIDELVLFWFFWVIAKIDEKVVYVLLKIEKSYQNFSL